jgi:alkylhydroperoxidase family enzyme
VVDLVLHDYQSAPVSPKLKALLNIAGKVQQNGKLVSEDDVADARKYGANDRDIHDTVLIAATFAMFNRYVDGLASITPTSQEEYDEMGKRLGEKGYVLTSKV